jgi:hypothetical protein
MSANFKWPLTILFVNFAVSTNFHCQNFLSRSYRKKKAFFPNSIHFWDDFIIVSTQIVLLVICCCFDRRSLHLSPWQKKTNKILPLVSPVFSLFFFFFFLRQQRPHPHFFKVVQLRTIWGRFKKIFRLKEIFFFLIR